MKINGDETVVAIEGALEGGNAQEMQPVTLAIVNDGRKNVTLDFSGLDLIDSQGVAAVVGLLKHVKSRGGVVKVVGIRDQPLAIFKLLRYDKVFDLSF